MYSLRMTKVDELGNAKALWFHFYLNEHHIQKPMVSLTTQQIEAMNDYTHSLEEAMNEHPQASHDGTDVRKQRLCNVCVLRGCLFI